VDGWNVAAKAMDFPGNAALESPPTTRRVLRPRARN